MNFSTVTRAAVALAGTASAFAPARHGLASSARQAAAGGALRMSSTWYEDDVVVTLVPKFKIKEGMKEEYIKLMPKFVELVKANEEETCVHYGFGSV